MSDFDSVNLEQPTSGVHPASDWVCTSLSESVKLRIGRSGLAAAKPVTIPELFKNTVHKFPTHPALAFESSPDEWKTVNYTDYYESVLQVGKAFIKLGLQPRTSVAVLAFNCPEWFYSQLGTLFAGGIITGIYTTNSPEAVYHVLSTSDAAICVVDDARQMDKVRAVRERLPKLKAIVQINGPFEEYIGAEDGYYKWSDIEEMDASDCEAELTKRTNELGANEGAMLIYTSGTVGLPKAVILSHDNVTWNSFVTVDRLSDNITYGDEVFVSYLPLNHIAAQVFDNFIPLLIGAVVYFADRNALKGSLVKTLRKARPTRLMGVPRVFEKFQEQLVAAELRSSSAAKFALKVCRSIVESYHMSAVNGTASPSIRYWFAEKLLRKVKIAMGLNMCRCLIIGGAPISKELKKFFMSYDMPLTEVLGMSESAGAITIGDPKAALGTCGKAVTGVELKIISPDKDGQGEICVRSRNIFMGYVNDTAKTNEAIDADGWFHTGDMGYIDMSGYLFISGRLKEIIITAGGENIPPANVESLIKSELPGLSYVFLIGDKRKYLSCLVTIKTEVDPETGTPTDKLDLEALHWVKSLELEYTTLAEILEAGPCSVILESIQEGINRANKNAISNAQKVQKFAVLSHDFSIGTGELGPTLKVKRSVVCDMYKDVIDSLYA